MQPQILEHDQAGDGDPPLVLIPGGFTGWVSWLPLVPALAADRRVVRVQPIVNREGMAGRIGDGSCDADVERESLALTLDSLGIDSMHLVGWSNGGRIALDFALAQPERVRTLTAIEPAAWWLLGDEESARDFETFALGCGGRECHAEDVQGFLAGVGIGPPGTDFTTLPQWDLWFSCRQVLSWLEEPLLRSAEAGTAGYEELAPPTLLIRGTRTAPWLRGVVDVLAEGLPDATVTELEGGHACLLEDPEGFFAALSGHIGRAG